MKVDYDFLVNKIEQISPHLVPKKLLWNYDILQNIKSRKAELDTITSYNSFWVLINRALQTCQDGHTAIRTTNDAYNNSFTDFTIELPFKYMNGEYITTRAFSFNELFFPAGTIATTFNNQNIHSYVQTIPQYRYFMQWDAINKRFYYNSFFATDNIAIQKSFILTLKKPNEESHTITFKTNDKVILEKSEATFSATKNVEYWDEYKLLYIRVPTMNTDDAEFYKKEIVRQSKDKQVEKVIVDIRNNLGGGDGVWQSIYETILPNAVTYTQKLCGNKPSFMSKSYLKEKGLQKERIKPSAISFLNNQQMYIYYDSTVSLKPSKQSIKCKGKIIVIGNENIYSSAGSCMSLPNSNPNDNIISIGRHTGRFLGAGYDPIECTLPNSKIKFIVEPAIDITNAKDAKDVMQDHYEITIPYTLQEFTDKYKYKGSIWSKDFLINYDPFIAKALLE